MLALRQDMRIFVRKLCAVLLFAARAAPMADAAGDTREDGVEKAKDAISELVTEEVTEDLGVGEQRPEQKHKNKSGKPRMSTSRVRQTWDECVGEEGGGSCRT